MQPADVACPVCGARAFDPAGVFARPKRPHTMYRCRACSVTVDSRAWHVDTACNLATQAAATGECYTRCYTPEEFERRVGVAQATLGEFSRFMRSAACFIELGVGEGFLARAAAGVFGTVYGLDIDLTAARNVSRQFGCPANLHLLPHDRFGAAEVPEVSAVALWHVLEHLHDPLAVLRPFLDRLAPGGVVIGQVPLLREDYVFDEHFLFYNESALLHLAGALDCTPVLMQRDEENDFLSFCLRKRPEAATSKAAASRGAVGTGGGTAGGGGGRPALRSLGVPALFVFGHQRSGTNVLVETLAAGLDCDVLNEDHAGAFSNFRLRRDGAVQALVAASPRGCLMKPITDLLRFREVMEGVPGSAAVFIVRNPLEVVPSFLMEFRDLLPATAYDIVHNYRWTRLRDVGVELEDWAEVDRVMDKYAGRFDPRRDAASVVALGWLLLHAALQGRGILGAAGCAVVDYADLFDPGGALGRKLAPALGADVPLRPARRRVRETHAFASSIDVELAGDCLDRYETFRSAGGARG